MSARHLSIALVALALSGCREAQLEHSVPKRSIVADAQAQSEYGKNPAWLDFSGERDKIQKVRNRAYEYCLREKRIDKRCAAEQDSALHASVVTLYFARDLKTVSEMDELDNKARWLAHNPDIVEQAIKECWALYGDHGSNDTRILAVCLGNLSDSSWLIELPVE